MDTTVILVKTDKGVEEVKHRSFGLPQHLRALLIMADGATSLSSLLSRTAQLPQSQESFEWLLREGFVETVSSRRTPGAPAAGAPAPHSAADRLPPKQMLVAMTRELLGPDAPKVIQRLQDAPESVAELIAAVERCHKFIKLTIDERKADQFLQTGKGLLAEFR